MRIIGGGIHSLHKSGLRMKFFTVFLPPLPFVIMDIQYTSSKFRAGGSNIVTKNN